MRKKVSRRELLSYSAAAVGGVLVGGTVMGGSPVAADVNPSGKFSFPYEYKKLNTKKTAQKGYEGFYEGRCCYGVFASVVGQLADKFGKPYSSFPMDMMVYGKSGVAGFGTLCGAVNGAAATIGLFLTGSDRDNVIAEMMAWYERTAIPTFTPRKPVLDVSIKKTLADSVLCHRSVGKWCEESGHAASSKERSERCARLTATVAAKTVELLNAHLRGTFEFGGVSSTADTCLSCHGKGKVVDNAKVKQDCGVCHDDKLNGHP